MKSRWGRTLVFLLLTVAIAASSPPLFAEESFRIGVPVYPTVAVPLFIAESEGFFQKNGLDVELIRINSEATNYQALISGSIDAVGGNAATFVTSYLQGVKLVGLGSWDNNVPYALVTRKPIANLRQLRGKKVGVNRLGGKSSLIVRVMFDAAGLDPMKDINLLQLGGSQTRLAALMKGGIDAGPVDFTLIPRVKKLGFFVVQGKRTPFLNTPIVVKRSDLQSRRPLLRNFMKAALEGTRYLLHNKKGAMEIVARVLKIKDKGSRNFIYNELRSRTDPSWYPPEAAIKNLLKMVGYLDKRALSIRPEQLFDFSILEELGDRWPAHARKY